MSDRRPTHDTPWRRVRPYAWSIGVTALATFVASLMFGRFALADLIMVYLLGVVVVSTRFGLRASIASAVMSVLAFDFFFVPPYLTLAVTDLSHVLTFAVMFVVAVVIGGLTDRAQRARVEVETERMRSNLLSSVSHDLRTPLATIEGAATTILQARDKLDSAALAELTGSIVEETRRLARLVRNLLDMTRLEQGGISVRRDVEAIEEIIGATLTRMQKQLEGRTVETHVPDDLPLVPMDPVLMEQVFTNLLENAIRYTPPGTPITISARTEGRELRVEVADLGPGLPVGSEQRVFDKFFRGDRASGEMSVGLGLTICRSILLAHGGRISARNRSDRGAVFELALPLSPTPTRLDGEPLHSNERA